MFFNEACLAYLFYQSLPRGYSGLVLPDAYPNWIVGGVHRTLWIFYPCVVHHPDY